MQVEPTQGAFHHPPTGQKDKAFLRATAHNRLQNKVKARDHPIEEGPAIGAVHLDAPPLLASPREALKHRPGSDRGRDRGGGHDNHPQQPQGIHQPMTFATLDLLATVKAAFTGNLGRLDALAVKTARCRMLVSSGLDTHRRSQGIVDSGPSTVISPRRK